MNKRGLILKNLIHKIYDDFALMGLVFLLTLAVLIINKISFEDELKLYAFYCSNVREGIHPDYKKIYKNYCKPIDAKTSK